MTEQSHYQPPANEEQMDLIPEREPEPVVPAEPPAPQEAAPRKKESSR